MRTLNSVEITLVKRLSGLSKNEGIDVGEWFKSEFLIDGGLLISSVHDYLFVLSETSTIKDKVIQRVIDLLSLLNELQEEGVIVLVPTEEISVLLYGGTKALLGEERTSLYTLESSTISIKDKICNWRNKDGKEVTGEKISSNLSRQVIDKFLSTIYLTSAYQQLINNNFESIEIKSYKQSVKDAKKGRNIAWVTLLLSILFQPFMTFFNNQFGKAELKSEQYDTIRTYLQDVNSNLDVISNNINSTKMQADSLLQNKKRHSSCQK